MPESPEVKEHRPSPIVRRTIVLALIAVAAVVPVVAGPNVAAATPTMAATVTVDPAPVQPGGQVRLDVLVGSVAERQALVDLEIYDGRGRRSSRPGGTTRRSAPACRVRTTPPGRCRRTCRGRRTRHGRHVRAGLDAALYHWNLDGSHRDRRQRAGSRHRRRPRHRRSSRRRPGHDRPRRRLRPATTDGGHRPRPPGTTATPPRPPQPTTTARGRQSDLRPVRRSRRISPPPAGVGRFDWQLHAGANGGACGTVSQDCGLITASDRAEHDMGCGAPTTYRHIAAQPSTTSWCSTRDLAADVLLRPRQRFRQGSHDDRRRDRRRLSLSFSPKQVFTDVRKVCFDINTNGNIGAGKWINAWIIPTSSLAANGGRFDFADAPDLDPEQQVPGPERLPHQVLRRHPDRPQRLRLVGMDRQASESATRFTQCVEQTAPDQLTYTRDFPADTNGDGMMDPGVARPRPAPAPGTCPTARPGHLPGWLATTRTSTAARRHHLALGQHPIS